MTDPMDYEEVRSMIDAVHAARPKVTVDRALIQSEREVAQLHEFVRFTDASQNPATALTGVPVIIDESTPGGVVRVCFSNGTAADWAIR